MATTTMDFSLSAVSLTIAMYMMSSAISMQMSRVLTVGGSVWRV